MAATISHSLMAFSSMVVDGMDTHSQLIQVPALELINIPANMLNLLI